MADSNFQDGVGQKIVEALKQQDDGVKAETAVKTEEKISSQNETLSFETPAAAEPETDSFSSAFEQQKLDPFSMEDDLYADTTLNFQSAGYQDTANFQPVGQQPPAQQSGHMPPNVAVLKRLITQLPNGVTKQTGAQIIRQTMEALGISMNNVLHEAQQVQDGLNDSVKTCMFSIQEYKNNIKQLEKQVLDYQKQIAYLNDLISLFVMTDNSR